MLLNVVETVIHMASIVVINAWSTMFCASVKFCSGLLTAMQTETFSLFGAYVPTLILIVDFYTWTEIMPLM